MRQCKRPWLLAGALAIVAALLYAAAPGLLSAAGVAPGNGMVVRDSLIAYNSGAKTWIIA